MQINLELLSDSQKLEFALFKDNSSLENIEQFVSQSSSAIFFHIGSEAFFGFCTGLETKEDLELFHDAAKNYKKKYDSQRIVGPLNFSTYNTYRLKAQDYTPSYIMEPPFDQALSNYLNAYGSIYESYLTYEINDFDELAKWAQQFDGIDEDQLKQAYDLKFIDSNFWLDNIERFYQSADKVFGENLAYSAISLETFKQKYGKEAAQLICPHTSCCLIEKKSNEIIGIILNFVDISDMSAKRLLIKTMGVHPDHRHMGLTFIFLLKSIIAGIRTHYAQAYLCLMREGNLPSLFAKDIAQLERRYNLYSL